MAYEGAVDESSFVAGPVLVSTIAALASPTVGLLLALLVAVVAQGGFGLHHSALPGRSTTPVTADAHPAGPLPRLHLAGLLLAMAAIGLVFGSSQTGVAARLDGLGRDELTGPVYAMMGVGSAVAGLLTTRLPRGFGLAARIAAGGAGLVVAGLLLAWATAPLALGGACLVAGIALAPSLISSYALAERAAPHGLGHHDDDRAVHRERGRRGRRCRGRGPAGRPGLPRRRPAGGLRRGRAGARRWGRLLADAAPRRLTAVRRRGLSFPRNCGR